MYRYFIIGGAFFVFFGMVILQQYLLMTIKDKDAIPPEDMK